MRVTRRYVLKGLAAIMLSGLLSLFYIFWAEPVWMMRKKRHSVRSRTWTGKPLKIAILADLHMGAPFVTLERLEKIVELTNEQSADIVFLMGDLVAGHHFLTQKIKVADTAKVLSKLSAPLGVFAVNGNHDWWDDLTAQRDKAGPVLAHKALENNGIHVLGNRAVKIIRNEDAFWLGGLESQLALSQGGGRFKGLHDLKGTLAQMDDEAPKILLAHEPDIFVDVPEDVSLTVSGHTHGGQVRVFGFSPVVPSRYGNRFAYGHIKENNRSLIVSGGIGCSIAPVRFGVPPEITLIELSRAEA